MAQARARSKRWAFKAHFLEVMWVRGALHLTLGCPVARGELGLYQHRDIGVETCIIPRLLIGKRKQQLSTNEGAYILGVMVEGKGILGLGGSTLTCRGRQLPISEPWGAGTGEGGVTRDQCTILDV